MLFEAHSTQLDLPIHSGLLPSSRTGPPLVLLLVISQTEPSSIANGEFVAKDIALVVDIALALAFQVADVNAHKLEFEILTAQAYRRKA